MIRSLLLTALVISASSILAACTHQPAETEVMDTTQVVPVETETDAMVQEESMIEDDSTTGSAMEEMQVTMDTGEFFFEPNVITAKPGQTVTVNLTNENGEMLHDFVIDELGVASEQITQGEETSVTFTVPESAAGQEYEFYCSVGQHRANGMVGTLRVLES